MKRSVFIVVFILICRQLHGYPSISPPLYWYGDITFEDSVLWVGMSTGWIYSVNPTTGNILDSIDTGISDAIDGIVYAKQHLWVTHAFSHAIQKINPSTGLVVQTFTHNISCLATHGIEYFNNRFYVNILYGGIDDSTAVFDTLFNFQFMYPNQAEFAHGLACNGINFFVTVNHSNFSNAAQVYKYDLSFNLLDSFPAPGGNYPNGLAFYKKCMWLSNTDSLQIYEMCELPLNVESFYEKEIVVYPNPAVDHIYINDPKKIINVQVFSPSGQLLRSGSHWNEDEKFDLVGIIRGKVYLKIIHVDGTVSSRQIIVGS